MKRLASAAVFALIVTGAASAPPAHATNASECLITSATLQGIGGPILTSSLAVTSATLTIGYTCVRFDVEEGRTTFSASLSEDYSIVGNCAAAVAIGDVAPTTGLITGASVWSNVFEPVDGHAHAVAIVFDDMCNATSATLSGGTVGVGAEVNG